MIVFGPGLRTFHDGRIVSRCDPSRLQFSQLLRQFLDKTWALDFAGKHLHFILMLVDNLSRQHRQPRWRKPWCLKSRRVAQQIPCQPTERQYLHLHLSIWLIRILLSGIFQPIQYFDFGCKLNMVGNQVEELAFRISGQLLFHFSQQTSLMIIRGCPQNKL